MLRLFNTEQQAQAQTVPTNSNEITLRYGCETVTVSAEAAAGKTVQQLFAENAGLLGIDPSRISAYRQDGNTIPADSTPQVGTSLQAMLSSESKGI